MYLSLFEEHFPLYVEAMKATEHNSPWHREGSVWTHTCMVYTAIKALHPDNKVLLITAILHDLGKTLTKSLNSYGGHSFLGHEGVSTFLATDILPIFDCSDSDKLHILRTISLHGVNTDQLSLPYLSMFRKADVIGRICDSSSSEYKPRKFRTPYLPSSHTITILCGLPCSGKSIYASSLGLPIISRDSYLMNNFGDPDEDYNTVYREVHSDALLKRELDEGFNDYIRSVSKAKTDAVIDMTMLSLKSRRTMMSQFPHAQFKCIVFLPRLSTIEARNDCRPGKFIQPEVLHSMMTSFVMPVREEGFVDIQYIF